ncbi:MAG: hypothetical protein RLZZ127_535 [Planctomycetota bacterium]|jgi:hypothetical protein
MGGSASSSPFEPPLLPSSCSFPSIYPNSRAAFFKAATAWSMSCASV